MLIKEYRIPMPMSVEEYRIAQLYMIQVKSLLLSASCTNKFSCPRGSHFWEVLMLCDQS